MSDFLAEARVLVRPDTTGFRAQLEAQLRAATAAPLIVPVTAAVTPGSAAGLGVQAQAAGALATANTLAAARTSALAAAQNAAAKAATGLAFAQSEVIGAASAVGAAQITLSRSTAAVAAAENALTVELRAGIIARIDAASAALGLAVANRAEAVAALAAARAEAVQTRTLAGLTAGAASAALAMVGLRGATLAASGPFLAAAAGAIAFGASLKLFADFEQELNTFQAVTGATADEMDRVSAAAERLGADVALPAVSAGDAAVAMTELARAGLSVEDSLAAAEGVLQLSTAAQIDFADAAKISANALNSFGLAGTEATRVADVFANAANESQGSIEDIGIAFRQASAVARQVGVSFEDTTALLTQFSRAGLTGSDAGTSLRTAFIKLTAPTDKARQVIKDLNLEIRDAQGNVRPDVFIEFGRVTRNLEPAARDAAAAVIFGTDAIRAAAIGSRSTVGEFRKLQAQMDQTGTASEVAAARTKGLGGSIQALKSTLETTGISIGRLVSGPIQLYIEGAQQAAQFTGLWVGALADLGAAAGDVQTPIGRLSDRLKNVLQFTGPQAPFFAIRAGLDAAGVGADKTKEKIADLQAQMDLLESAQVGTAEFAPGIAKGIKKQIDGIRAEIARLKAEAQGLATGVAGPMIDALRDLEEFQQKLGGPGIDLGVDKMIAELRELIPITVHTEGNIQRLRDDWGDLNHTITESVSALSAWRIALKAAMQEASRAQDELLRLQSEGGGPQAQIAALQRDIAAQFDIIELRQQQGPKRGASTAIREAREQIISNLAEIDGLQNEIASAAEDAAAKAKEAQKKRDEAFIRILEGVVLPIERLLARAGLTEGLADDIKFTDALIALYRKQIEQAAKRIGDVETRNRVLADLDDKLFQAILDRKKLQQDNRDKIREALEERQEELVRAAEIRVEFADLAENVKKGVQARLRLIAALKREARVLKLQGNALLENKLERARIRKEIQDLLEEGKEDQNIGKQINFRILQQAEGFATSIMSNLIPAHATAGALAGRGPAAAPQEGIRREAGLAAGRDTTVSRGQGNETNAILRSILRQLENLNGRTLHPEATRQRRQQGASQDTVAL